MRSIRCRRKSSKAKQTLGSFIQNYLKELIITAFTNHSVVTRKCMHRSVHTAFAFAAPKRNRLTHNSSERHHHANSKHQLTHPFDCLHIKCSVLEQPLWGTTGLREHFTARHLRQITHKRLSSVSTPHDHHNGRETHQTSSNVLCKQRRCNPPAVFPLPYSQDVFLYPHPQNTLMCLHTLSQ